MKLSKILTTSVALAALSFATASSALYIDFTSGGASTTVTDNGAGDGSGFNNIITFNETVGDWDVVSGLSFNKAGPGEIFYLNTSAVDLNIPAASLVTATDDLVVTAYAMGLTDKGSLASFNSFVNLTGSASTVLSISMDNGANWDVLSSYTAADPSGHGDFFNLASLDGSVFDLKITQTFQAGSNGGAITTVNVPEPSIIALMGLGLVGMGMASRRKQKKAA